MLWLIAAYLAEIWKIRYLKHEADVDRHKMFGFLKFKYRMDQVGARCRLEQIQFLVT